MDKNQELELGNAETNADLLELVSPERRQAFLQFIRTGEADDDFLNFLNHDENCQQAVEVAFTREAAGFEDLAEALKQSPDDVGSIIVTPIPITALSARIAATVEMAKQAEPADMDRLVENYAAKIAAAMPLNEVGIMTKVVKALGNNLAKVNNA